MRSKVFIVLVSVVVMAALVFGFFAFHTFRRAGEARALLEDLTGTGYQDFEAQIAAREELIARNDRATMRVLIDALDKNEYADLVIPILATKGEEVVSPVIRVLRRDKSYLTKVAEEVHSKSGDRISGAVLDLLSSDVEFGVRSAASVLVSMGEPAIDGLIEALDDRHPHVRAYSVVILGHIGVDRVVDPIVGATRDKEPMVRWNAARALAMTRHDEVLIPLVKLIDDKDPRVAGAALAALASLMRQRVQVDDEWLTGPPPAARHDGPLSFACLKGTEVTAALVDLVYHGNASEKDTAALLLGHIQDPACVEPLMKAFETNLGDAGWAVVDTLTNIGDPRAVPALISALRYPNAKVRKAAAFAFETFKDERAVKPLTQAALHDSDEQVRKAAVYGLDNQPGPEAITGILEAYADKSEVVRKAVINSLGDDTDPRSIEGVIHAFDDPSAEVRRQAVWSARWTPTPEGVKMIITALKDEAEPVRTLAARALAQLDDPSAAGPIAEMLDDPDEQIRSQAAVSLGFIKSPVAVDALRKALEDESDKVKFNVACALSIHGDAHGFDVLKELIDDHKTGVSARTVIALALLDTPEADASLEKVLAEMDMEDVAENHREYILRGESANDLALVVSMARRRDMKLAEDLYWCGRPDMKDGAGWWARSQGRFDELSGSEDSEDRPKWGSDRRNRIQILTAQLKDPDPEERKSAAFSLGLAFLGYAPRNSVSVLAAGEPVVVKSVGDIDYNPAAGLSGSPFGMGANVWAADRIGERRLTSRDDILAAIDALIAALDDESVAVRGNACKSLGRTHDASVIDALAGTMRNDPALEVRLAAVSAVASIDEPEAMKVLAEAMEDPEVKIRAMAVAWLGAYRREGAVELLIRALDDIDEKVQKSAMWQLGYIEAVEAVDPLILRLESTDTEMRLIAAANLVRIATRKALAAVDGMAPGFNLEQLAEEYEGYILAGRSDMVEPLIAALIRHGRAGMSADFYWSGNSSLQKAAEIKEHKYDIAMWHEMTPDDPNRPKWPGGTPPVFVEPAKESQEESADDNRESAEGAP